MCSGLEYSGSAVVHNNMRIKHWSPEHPVIEKQPYRIQCTQFIIFNYIYKECIQIKFFLFNELCLYLSMHYIVHVC